MPRIFDNIEHRLNEALSQTLSTAKRADFCVGYFNLRGWREIDEHIHNWQGDENSCRLMVGMHRSEKDEIRRLYRSRKDDDTVIDNATALRCKEELAREFRTQLMLGAPTKADEEGLRRLAEQLREGRVRVKLFLRYQLHAKLYLAYNKDNFNNPVTGFLGSSNLTFAGLAQQGELNVDVLEHDASKKLADWFEERWNDRRCVDITAELIKVLEESWITPRTPYQIYLKMAYHLASEARAGLAEFRLPSDFGSLFEYQNAAVRIAAHHLSTRKGVVIGDVVGLGKTLMATALARIFEDDFGLGTLIISPPNLQKMWEEHVTKYRLRGKVISSGGVVNSLHPQHGEPRRRILIIDESHNLRSRDGKKYTAIKEYIERNGCKVILLSATPYNKNFSDLSSQLRLFWPESAELPTRPERLLREKPGVLQEHNIAPRSLRAFELSPYTDDWRELMRLYMVRRTRGFIKANYAKFDEEKQQHYLPLADGTPSYFPQRRAKTIKFASDSTNPEDQFAQLYAEEVVDALDGLRLPRYGLGQYLIEDEIAVKAERAQKPLPDGSGVLSPVPASAAQEGEIAENLSRAGERLKGFCRTGLFKRLESSGHAFLLSLKRHILRNEIFLYALDNDLPLPIGTQNLNAFEIGDRDPDDDNAVPQMKHADAKTNYRYYAEKDAKKFEWLRAGLFAPKLKKDLKQDARELKKILERVGDWDTSRDEKLKTLEELIQKTHPSEKVLIFSQFSDTVEYLHRQLSKRGVQQISLATGDSENATELAWKFSPVSNEKPIAAKDELRVLIATDVLSEGQNLQDAHIIINYDLPWAIIRLIQRAGRVDRIGQKAPEILCYSFLPAEGIEKIIDLRGRLVKRLRESADVLGADEGFFEEDEATVVDLYNEKSTVLDGDEGEVDLASQAFQIWKNAIDADPKLESIIRNMPDVVYSAKSLNDVRTNIGAAIPRRGALMYARTARGNDALAWLDERGQIVTESQFTILRAAECSANTPATEILASHHDLVETGLELANQTDALETVMLGRPGSVKRRVYERLKNHCERLVGTLFENAELLRLLDEWTQHSLLDSSRESLGRQLRSGITDNALGEMLLALREDNRLFLPTAEGDDAEPQIICSLGLT